MTDLRQSGLIIIVFAAMCLEALINRYGVLRTSRTYFRNYLDKLDLTTKWLLIPKLVRGDGISSDSQAFQALRELLKYRNAVVHYKPREVIEFGNDAEFQELLEDFRTAVSNAVRALILLPAELTRLDSKFFGEYNEYDPSENDNALLREYV